MTDFRGRLAALRGDALRQLEAGEGIDLGLLAIIGNVAAALDALDGKTDIGNPITLAERAIVVDDGYAVSIVVYLGAERIATVPLDPARCVFLAMRLLESAGRRL